jgi:rod shape-determining protein MreC
VGNRLDSVLLAVLLLGNLALLSSGDNARGSNLEVAVLNTVAPVARGVETSRDTVGGMFESMRLNRALEEENQVLREEVGELRERLVKLLRVEEELARLSALSQYARYETGDSFVADVVYIDSSSWFRTLVLYTGSNHARKNQPVVTEEGLVGRIVVATERYAKVLLLTDRASSTSAMIERTRRRGLLHGRGDHLILDNIPLLEDVAVGDRVMTAGIDGVFPRGIPIGRITQVSPGSGLFHHIEVAATVDIGRLDQVYVLVQETLPEEIREAQPGEEP